MQTSAFDIARRVSAADVARMEGLHLVRKGGREWACCPLHGEKTASLCFYPDGRWYCFGCHASGDAVDLLAALRGIKPIEAARMLAGMDELPRQSPRKRWEPPPPAYSGQDDDGFTWDRLCRIRHKASEAMGEIDTPQLWEALEARAVADDRLNNFEAGRDYEKHGRSFEGI